MQLNYQTVVCFVCVQTLQSETVHAARKPLYPHGSNIVHSTVGSKSSGHASDLQMSMATGSARNASEVKTGTHELVPP